MITVIVFVFTFFFVFFFQSTMLQGIERYLKQAIVDKNASVSSASLVSALVSVKLVLKNLNYFNSMKAIAYFTR